ncbi:MAG: hydroxymethylglutaryl-CoA reductase [Pseudomonadota bacterium]
MNNQVAAIPMRFIGPVRVRSEIIDDEQINVPLATYETTLWPSTARGAKVSCLAGGIAVSMVSDCMTRSISLEAPSAKQAVEIARSIEVNHYDKLAGIVSQGSRFAKLQAIQHHIIGKTIYLRLSFTTGDASGHNMVTFAAEHIQNYLLSVFADLRYVSISGNYCVDKKVSAVNAILGRGKYMIAEINISENICQQVLNTTPARLVDLHIKKNLIGSIAAGSLQSANAHFANILLAMYLATGQDGANIVEGSQGITHAQCDDQGLYFSVTIPNLIVGTVGHGKMIGFVKDNLEQLGCLASTEPGLNARRLAEIIAATVLCGELSLLAALTNPDELMRAHQLFERRNR